MKILVFSDTHNSSSRMPHVMETENDVDACIFLGDGTRDCEYLEELYPNLPVYRVSGNCDYASFDPYEGIAVFDGVLVFYTHGHTYGVKTSLEPLWQAAASRGATVALFGHTHVAHYEVLDDIHIFNPGSLSIPRGGAGASYGIITIKNGTPRFKIKAYAYY